MRQQKITKARANQVLKALSEDMEDGLATSDLLTYTGLKRYVLSRILVILRQQGQIHRGTDHRWHYGPEPENGPRAEQIVSVPTSQQDRIVYPFPLNNGELVFASLPIRLSKIDAERIGRFVQNIAIPTE